MATPALGARVLLLGDVHAEHDTLARIFEAVDDCDRCLCVGDIADGRGDLDATLALLRARGAECVRGNHDRWALAGEMRQLEGCAPLSEAARAFLAGLPSTRRYRLGDAEVELCHAVGEDDMQVLFPWTELEPLRDDPALGRLQDDPALAWVVAGHTHVFMVRRIGRQTWINPGTLRRGATAEGAVRWPTWAVWDTAGQRLERWELIEGRRSLRETIELSGT